MNSNTPDYLSYQFQDSPQSVSTFDELPLWSAYFGILFLKHFELNDHSTILDIGSGTGFPILELASRVGNSCRLYGLDPWKHANSRAREKILKYQIENAEIVEGTGEKIPFPNHSVDAIVSNLGINNFENPSKVLQECLRVLKANGKLVVTTNVNGHWKEFYQIFENTLKTLQLKEAHLALIQHQQHRGSREIISRLCIENSFVVRRFYEETFEMKFLNGTAFLNHHFIKLGWLDSWRKLLAAEDIGKIFEHLEQNLNSHSEKNKGLTLTVPMLYLECESIAI